MHTTDSTAYPVTDARSSAIMSNIEMEDDEAAANAAMISNEEYKSEASLCTGSLCSHSSDQLTDSHLHSLEEELTFSLRPRHHTCSRMAYAHMPVVPGS